MIEHDVNRGERAVEHQNDYEAELAGADTDPDLDHLFDTTDERGEGGGIVVEQGQAPSQEHAGDPRSAGAACESGSCAAGEEPPWWTAIGAALRIPDPGALAETHHRSPPEHGACMVWPSPEEEPQPQPQGKPR